jgi:hypothetical protein
VLEGLKHGARYKVTVRQGLPSSVDESLLDNADYEVYVRDRSPLVQFVGKSYVLPRTGQSGIPLVSVNTSKAKLELFRIGDRSLLSAVSATSSSSSMATRPPTSPAARARRSGKAAWTWSARPMRTSPPRFRWTKLSARSRPASM